MGIVFDLQRCSLHDGPGIRTTVFLKGCPLRCVWCHNPESYRREPQISYQAARCTDCQTCADLCSHSAHRWDETGQHILDRQACQVCGQCVSACPQEALRLIGQEMDVPAIMAEVEADRIFYQRSGGGLTLSGGEPLLQFEFTRQLLEEAVRREIHTCLETSGQAPLAHYADLLPLVNLFLFDYKASDAQKHRDLTGVSNQHILSVLAFLLDSGAQLILRCPLVPGVNDDPGHLAAIAAIAARRPGPLRVELMAYHNLGREKALQVGAQPLLEALPTTPSVVQQAWLEQLSLLGCNAVFG